jgi:hypothetical protein
MVHAQDQEVDHWNVPWVVIGDSTLTPVRNSKGVVTGTILDAGSQQLISAVSVSADLFKYHDTPMKTALTSWNFPRGITGSG